MRPRLHWDFETFSDVSLLTAGASVYAARSVPLLLGLKLNDDETEVFDYSANFNGGMDDFGDWDDNFSPDCPDMLKEAIKDDWWIIAHNAPFEYGVTLRSPATRHWPKPKIERMICTAAKSRYWGLPSALDKVGRVLSLDTQKDKEGSRLIKKFCIPAKVGRGKGASTAIRTINPRDPDWLAFKEYNRIDVETEYGVDCALPDIPTKDARAFYIDFRMNERGFPVDLPAVKAASVFYKHFYGQMDKRFKVLSKGLAPTQVAKIKDMLNEDHGEDFDNLQSSTLRDRLLEADLSPEVREMIEIRAQAAQASVKKLTAFLNRTGADGRARGGFMWYGAHTGRWSGKGIQPQNFPRGIKELMSSIAAFFEWCAALTDGNADVMLAVADFVYVKPLGVLSTSMRGFIKAPKGKRFVVVDYAQIELRVLAWLAGAQKTLDRLRAGVDPYKAFAAERMYNCTVDEVTPYQRQIAKSALLGAQYQIWIDAFIEYCAKVANIKISKEEATNAVLSYRADNPEIVEYWSDVEEAVISAVENKGTSKLNNLVIRFEEINGYEWLRIYLPSGRPISYFEPQVRWRTTTHEAKDKDGNVLFNADGSVKTYEKTKQVFSFLTEYMGRTTREYTYGGKLVENITQGVAYDIMAEGMGIAEEEGYWPIMTVHDEVVTEVDEGFGSLKELESLVCQLPACYEGLPMAAEGFECIRYRKG